MKAGFAAIGLQFEPAILGKLQIIQIRSGDFHAVIRASKAFCLNSDGTRARNIGGIATAAIQDRPLGGDRRNGIRRQADQL